MNRAKIQNFFRQLLARFPDAPAFLLIGLSLAWCLSLWILKAQISGRFHHNFLPYNLSLALIPLILSTAVVRLQHKAGLAAGSLVWLAFFPNAPYLITDLIHLRAFHRAAFVPFWLDWVFLVSCAGTGLLIGLVSLRQIYRRIRDSLGTATAEISAFSVLALSGFAIYLGRFLRWNSWDMATRPFEFAADVLSRLMNPFDHPKMIAYSISVAVMLTLSWLAFRIWSLKSDCHPEPD